MAATQYDKTSGKAYFSVPFQAMTGDISIYSLVNGVKTDFTGGAFPLEIVPVLSRVDVTSVASDGSSAQVTLTGFGFIEGNLSSYQFGTTTIFDSGVNTGPDVFFSSVPNSAVNLTVPLSAGAFGPISVTTAGGTSTPLSFGLTGITSAALSGTPANASVASANPGQAITLAGHGLTTSSDIFLNYLGSDGVQRTVLLNPAAAAANGTTATLIVPPYANGVTTLSVLGSSTSQTLQIVPTLTSYSVDGTNTLRLFGTGLQEGSASNTVTYNFAGGSVSDTAGEFRPRCLQQHRRLRQQRSSTCRQSRCTVSAPSPRRPRAAPRRRCR